MKCVTGINGFIGSVLAKRLGVTNDVPNDDTVYYFGSPSSNILFNQNIDYCMRETIEGFLNTISYCKTKGLYLVYPSSATVNNKNNNYAHCKAALEEIAAAYDCKTLGLRISAGYGVVEEHKGDYASVIYQWCKQMINNERPTIFGTGEQTRDFIYIDDIIDNIIELTEKETTGIVEIGTGINTSFNDVIKTINKVLDKNILPCYVSTPKNYISDTPVKAVPTKVSLEEGIRKICQSLK